MSVKVKFKIGEKKGITANYTVNNNNPIRTVFKINAASASFYSLTGSPYDNANLKDALDAKADKSELESDMAAVDEAISNVQTVIENNYNTLDNKIDNVNSDLSGDISALENTVNNNNTAVNSRIDATNQTVADNNTAINNRVDGIVDSFDGDISALETAIQNEATTRANNDTLLQGDINTLRNDLTSEISNRTSADNTLQDNIDNIQNTIDNYGDIISYNASDFATAAQGLLAESALQPNDNISELNNDAGYLTDADLSGYLRNTATGSNSLTIDGIASNKTNSINIGAQSTVNNNSIALGYYATASGSTSIALGVTANAFAQNSIQIGSGANSTANTLQVRSYTLLDTSTGLIPDERISSNIARSSDIPTFTDAQIAALNSGANTTNIGQIATNTSNISSLSNTVTSNYNTLDDRITSEVNTLNGAITTEATNRQNADNALQTQIDAITSASDVFDIVGTYAELQAYDITTVPVNDIIKVLVDSTHNNAATYYRCVENNNVKSWNYIGAEGAYYTKSEADNKFVEQTITVNGQPLSSNVTLTASDVGALPSSTTIGAGVLTIQKNGVDVDTFNANATTNKTINITVPTDTNDLTNGAGFITSNALTGYATETWVSNQGYLTAITSSDVTTALGYTPYNSTNPDGYITASDLPTNYVTTDTAQDISGRKTFLGEKAIYFKQQAASNKLGFTLYNPSNTELAALEYRPNTISGASLLALNCPQTTGGYVGFRYWGTPAVNIVAPKVATAGNYFMATHITNGTLTVTANNQGTVNISTLLPDVSNFVTNTSLATTLADYVTNSALNTTLADYALSADIPAKTSDLTNDSNFATVSQIPTNNNQLTNGAGYITSSALNGYAKTADLATVATSGSYNDLTDKPTIPAAQVQADWNVTNTSSMAYIKNKPTIPSAVTESTVSGWGFTKNSGTVTSVNNVSPVNGNVTLSIPAAQVNADWNATSGVAQILNKPTIPTVGNGTVTINQGGTQKGTFTLNQSGNTTINLDTGGTVDQTFDSTSQNAQSGVAIAGAGFLTSIPSSYLQNVATDTNALSILSNNSNGTATTLIGVDTVCSAPAQYGTAIGYHARLGATSSAIQLGYGTNSTANSFNVGFYNNSSTHYNWQLLDGTTGLIPDARLSSNIARTNDIPDISTLANTDLSNLSTTGQAVIDGKVSKSGDTMTGALNLDMTTVGSSNENFQDITFTLDDINRAGLRCSHSTDGTNRVQIIVRNNSGTFASGYEASNNNGTLSCSFPDTTCVDGQWQFINTVIMDNVSVKGSSNLTYTLSDVPNDGHMYEVMLTGNIQTGTTSGNFCALQLRSDFSNSATAKLCNARTRSSSFMQAQGTVIIPLTTSRKIYVSRNSGWEGTAQLWLIGYRRIGTNS